MRRSWAEISVSRLRSNLTVIQQLAAGRPVIAVVKANAYGHGLGRVAEVLWKSGVRRFAVAELEEGAELRQFLPEAEILVLGGCDPGDASEFRALRLTAALFREEIPPGVRVELEVETGMGRLGLPRHRIRTLAERLGRQVAGVFSTLACSDSDPEFTALQVDRFRQATEGIPVLRHLANSAALTHPAALMDAVRPGLALYGIATVPSLADLQPVMTWKARVIAVNELPVGATVGYGAAWRADRTSRIAVIGVGYADGYRRGLSCGASVGTVHGTAAVVGRISMDLTAIDVTDLPAIQPGAEVTLLDADPGSPRSAAELARRLGTIPYDILATVGPRVLRVYRE